MKVLLTCEIPKTTLKKIAREIIKYDIKECDRRSYVIDELNVYISDNDCICNFDALTASVIVKELKK